MTRGDTASRDNAAVVRRYYEDLWNQFDKSLIVELLTENLRFRGSLGQEKSGHQGFADYLDFIRAAFPDFHNEILDLVSEGSRSFAQLRYRGTHRGEIFGIAPTGSRVSYSGAALFTFQGSRICELWVLGDVHALVLQLAGGKGSP